MVLISGVNYRFDEVMSLTTGSVCTCFIYFPRNLSTEIVFLMKFSVSDEKEPRYITWVRFRADITTYHRQCLYRLHIFPQECIIMGSVEVTLSIIACDGWWPTLK